MSEMVLTKAALFGSHKCGLNLLGLELVCQTSGPNLIKVLGAYLGA